MALKLSAAETPFETNGSSTRKNGRCSEIRAAAVAFTVHDLRHTAGSLLVNEGHTIKQVQEFLGHEKASTTLDIYAHVSMEGKKATANAMDQLLA